MKKHILWLLIMACSLMVFLAARLLHLPDPVIRIVGVVMLASIPPSIFYTVRGIKQIRGK